MWFWRILKNTFHFLFFETMRASTSHYHWRYFNLICDPPIKLPIEKMKKCEFLPLNLPSGIFPLTDILRSHKRQKIIKFTLIFFLYIYVKCVLVKLRRAILSLDCGTSVPTLFIVKMQQSLLHCRNGRFLCFNNGVTMAFAFDKLWELINTYALLGFHLIAKTVYPKLFMHLILFLLFKQIILS